MRDSIIQPNGQINIAVLQNEIIQDISNDSQYSAENEMKKRAVHTSQDYSEFQNFVKCSQLKPVPSQQMGELFVQRKTGRSAEGCAEGCADGNGIKNSSRSSNNSGSRQNKFYSISKNDLIGKRIANLMNDISEQENSVRKPKTEVSDNDGNCEITQQQQDVNDNLIIESKSPASTIALNQILNQSIKSTSTTNSKKKKKENAKPQTKTSHRITKAKLNQIKRPRNAMEFEKEWKCYCHSNQNIISYLTMSEEDDVTMLSTAKASSSVTVMSNLSIPEKLRNDPLQVSNTIFHVEINSSIMGGIIEALELLLLSIHDNDNNDDDNNGNDGDASIASSAVTTRRFRSFIFVYQWMLAMTKCGRFGLNIQFVNQRQQQCIESILDILDQYNSTSISIGRIDSFDQNDIQQLSQLYNV
jgi:hypothetical protein